MRLPLQLVCLPILLCLAFTSCDKDIPAPPNAEKTPGRTVKPIPGVSLDRIKPAWEGKYTVTEEPTGTKFERQIGSHQIVLEIKHNEAGEVSNLRGAVIGPAEATQERGQGYAAMLEDVVDALGMAANADVKARIEIAELRLGAGYGYDFRQDRIGFFLMPDRTEDGKSERVLSLTTSKSTPGGSLAVAGSSVEQLRELLADFEAKATIEGEEVLFVRDKETHKEAVLCHFDEKNEIRRIAAFLTDVKPDAPVKDLRHLLWVILGDLDYEEANPEKAKEFILGPKMAYAAGDGRDIGFATFYSNIDSNGDRSVLEVFPAIRRMQK